uniref:PML-RARA-regulated adapter molecule 1 n=1 Tax=Spermophilus dauricus TaxID=99837 RepID=A0A8C9QBH5_SPEDA
VAHHQPATMGSHKDFRSLQAKFQASQSEPNELPKKPPKPEFNKLLNKFPQPELSERPPKPLQPDASEAPQKISIASLRPPQPQFVDLPKKPLKPEFTHLPKKPQQPEFTDLPKKPQQTEFTDLPNKASKPEFTDLPKKFPQLESTPFLRKPLQPEVSEAPQKVWQSEPSTLVQKPPQPELSNPAKSPAEPKLSTFPKKPPQPEFKFSPQLLSPKPDLNTSPKKPPQPQTSDLHKFLTQPELREVLQKTPLEKSELSEPHPHYLQPGLSAFPKKPPQLQPSDLPKKVLQPEFSDLTRTSSEPEVFVLPKKPRQLEFKALSKMTPKAELGSLPRTSSEPEFSSLPRKFQQPERQGPPRKFSQPEPNDLPKKHLQPKFFRDLSRKPPLLGSVSESSLPSATLGSSPRYPLSPGFGATGATRWRSEDFKAHNPPQRRPLPPASILGPPPAKPPLPPVPMDIQSFRRSSAESTALRRTRSSAGTHFLAQQPKDFPWDPDETYELYDNVEPKEDSGPSPRGRDEVLCAQQATRRHSQDPELRKEKAPQTQQLPPTDPKLLKQIRKAEKAEREFRKKFKFEGEIVVHTRMMIDPNAKTRRGGGKHLGIRRGEILEVIEFTSKEEMLCRDPKGKYGYVPRIALLPLETEVYDDDGLEGTRLTAGGPLI